MSITVPDTNRKASPEAELDDIDAYVATFDEEERQELAAAEAAIDIAILLYRAREHRGLSQAAAAEMAGLHQQAVSRFEHPSANPQLETMQAYLGALGYALELKAIDLQTGEAMAELVLPPTLPRNSRRITPRSRRKPGSHRRQERAGQSPRTTTA